MIPPPPAHRMTGQRSIVMETMSKFKEQWCVYQHLDADDAILYIGTCKLTEAYQFPDARTNSEWIKRVTPATVIQVRILWTGTRMECANERGRLVMTTNPRPPCNMMGFETLGTVQQVTCNETGQTFDTQMDACRTMNLPQPSLSSHLAGRAGFPRVKGYKIGRAHV